MRRVLFLWNNPEKVHSDSETLGYFDTDPHILVPGQQYRIRNGVVAGQVDQIGYDQ